VNIDQKPMPTEANHKITPGYLRQTPRKGSGVALGYAYLLQIATGVLPTFARPKKPKIWPWVLKQVSTAWDSIACKEISELATASRSSRVRKLAGFVRTDFIH
jgi:hypothetical protein